MKKGAGHSGEDRKDEDASHDLLAQPAARPPGVGSAATGQGTTWTPEGSRVVDRGGGATGNQAASGDAGITSERRARFSTPSSPATLPLPSLPTSYRRRGAFDVQALGLDEEHAVLEVHRCELRQLAQRFDAPLDSRGRGGARVVVARLLEGRARREGTDLVEHGPVPDARGGVDVAVRAEWAAGVGRLVRVQATGPRPSRACCPGLSTPRDTLRVLDPEAEQDPLALSGTTIEGTTYRVERLVGEGGFGCVYVAHDDSLDRKVALKVLRVPSMLSRSEEQRMRESFIAEGKLLARLNHPHTVRVFACGYHGKLPYLALEWLDGRNLADAFAEYQRTAASRLSQAQVLDLLLPVFEALAEAHELGVVHRDIKPDNLFICERPGRQSIVKVLDFGVGKLTELGQSWDQLSTATRAGRVAFTPTYGAPEQFFPKQFGSTGPWTDVHALGLVMIELCTGETAFREEGPDLFVEAARPERPSPRRAGVPVSDAFEELCRRCVALAPRDRFQSAGELAEAAAAVRRGLGDAASVVPLLVPRGTAAVGASAPRNDPPPTVPAPPSFTGHVPDDTTAEPLLLSGAKTERS
jgi:serine/threonine-protein kinase